MPANARPVSVGVSVTKGANYDPDRTSLIFYNLGAAAVYYGFNAETTTTTGIPIGPSNAVVFSWDTGDDPTAEYYMISGGAGNDVRVGEQWGVVPASKRRTK